MTPTTAWLSRHAVSVPGALAIALIALGMNAGVPGAAVALGGMPPASVTTPAAEIQGSSAALPGPSTSPAPADAGVDYAKDRDAIFDAFYTTGLEATTAYAVSNLAIKKDNMTLLLKQGTVFLMKPIAGEITGAAFVGDGEASMTPPNHMARFMLNKYSGAEILKEPFSEAVFRFSDGTERTIRAQGHPDPSSAGQAQRAGEILKDRNGWLDGTRLLHDRAFALEMQFLENRISHLRGQDFFLVDFHSPKHDWLTYLFDLQAIHENFLGTSATLGAKGRRYIVPWAVWHKQSDYDAAGHYVMFSDRDGPRVIMIEHTDLTLNLPTTRVVEWQARLKVVPLLDDVRCFRFDLVNNARSESRWYEESFWPVKVVSVSDDSGAQLQFQHKKDQLLVLLPQPLKAGVPMTIVTKGTAEVIYQLTAESFGLLEDAWYPQYGYMGGRQTFHWTVRVPQPFLLTGSGKIVREFEDKERNQNGIELECDRSVHFPWVIFGRFQKAQTTYASAESSRTIPLTIHSFPTMTISITDSDTLEEIGATRPVTFNLQAPPGKVNGLLDESKEVLKLFEKIYGPYPYDELHIAQMAPQLDFGQSPMGFVQLTGIAFLSQAQLESDFVHGFLAHEIAHQWWAHQVGWASEMDDWLSESFAEYASGIFVKEYQGPKRFQRTLQQWKQRAKLADKEAPIAWASALAGPNAYDLRTDLLYAKGPYVLHMLRVQLDDEKYTQVMRSIQETYRNRNISTEMLLAQVNRVTGQDYTSFFDQWVWGIGIPTFRYSWRSEKQADGKFLISVHVSQDDKINLKKVLMPVYVHFKDKTIPQYKPVVQAEQDIKIMSPIDPKDVTLDDEHTLLAEIVKAS